MIWKLSKKTKTENKDSGLNKLAARFTRVRGSKYFLIGIVSFIAVWVFIHFSFNLDPEWGGLNLCLSSEASIALAFFTMMADKQEEFQKRQLKYMQHLLESQLVVLKQLATHIEQKDQ